MTSDMPQEYVEQQPPVMLPVIVPVDTTTYTTIVEEETE